MNNILNITFEEGKIIAKAGVIAVIRLVYYSVGEDLQTGC